MPSRPPLTTGARVCRHAHTGPAGRRGTRVASWTSASPSAAYRRRSTRNSSRHCLQAQPPGPDGRLLVQHGCPDAAVTRSGRRAGPAAEPVWPLPISSPRPRARRPPDVTHLSSGQPPPWLRPRALPGAVPAPWRAGSPAAAPPRRRRPATRCSRRRGRSPRRGRPSVHRRLAGVPGADDVVPVDPQVGSKCCRYPPECASGCPSSSATRPRSPASRHRRSRPRRRRRPRRLCGPPLEAVARRGLDDRMPLDRAAAAGERGRLPVPDGRFTTAPGAPGAEPAVARRAVVAVLAPTASAGTETERCGSAEPSRPAATPRPRHVVDASAASRAHPPRALPPGPTRSRPSNISGPAETRRDHAGQRQAPNRDAARCGGPSSSAATPTLPPPDPHREHRPAASGLSSADRVEDPCTRATPSARARRRDSQLRAHAHGDVRAVGDQAVHAEGEQQAGLAVGVAGAAPGRLPRRRCRRQVGVLAAQRPRHDRESRAVRPGDEVGRHR